MDSDDIGLLILDVLDGGAEVTREAWDRKMTNLFSVLGIPAAYLQSPERQRWQRSPPRVEDSAPVIVIPDKGWHGAVLEAFKKAPCGARIRMPTKQACEMAQRAQVQFGRTDILFVWEV